MFRERGKTCGMRTRTLSIASNSMSLLRVFLHDNNKELLTGVESSICLPFDAEFLCSDSSHLLILLSVRISELQLNVRFEM
jgi:hypothetical protein